MNRLILLLLLMTCPVMLARGAEPQSGQDDAPIKKIVAAALEAAKKQDWNAYTELVHLESLQAYKKMWLPILEAAAKDKPDKQAELLALFDKPAELESVIGLKPNEFFIRSMKGIAAQTTVPKPDPAKTAETILGTVREGNDLAHVLVRTRMKSDQVDVNRVEVLTLKRAGTEWKLLLPDVVYMMADTFRNTGQPGEARSGPIQDRPDPNK